jgi:hypothetical protein
VHWNSDAWVELQVQKLRKFITLDMQLYAFMDGVSPELNKHFDQVFYNDDLSHPEKLDYLAREIATVASPHDILLFIDGDAFPIANLGSVFDSLTNSPLLAVRRDENFGDKQPHPCFCVTTVELWHAIAGTWKPGIQWMRDDGNMGSDVGGNLYGALRDAGIQWQPLLRSNRTELHPLFFGIYADKVYHHGAGFRDKLCRRDARRGIDAYSERCISLFNRWQGKRLLRIPRAWLRRHVNGYMRKRNGRLHEQVMREIVADENFAVSLHLVTTP